MEPTDLPNEANEDESELYFDDGSGPWQPREPRLTFEDTVENLKRVAAKLK